MPDEVLIIGAGFAGLAAALELHRSGVSVRLLEARNRLGGRAATLHLPNLEQSIELGAEFIHGRPPEIFSIAGPSGLDPIELGGEQWCVRDGLLQPCGLFDRIDSILSNLDDSRPDVSFLEYVRDHVEVADPEDLEWAIAYVRGFHAADPAQISVHSIVHGNRAEEKIEGDRQFRPSNGYDRLVQWYAAELAGTPIELNTTVHRIRWSLGHVEVAAERNGVLVPYSAPMALVTLPLGVLQALPGSPGAVEFEPSIPEKARACAALRMGQVARVTLQFNSPFWRQPKDGTPDLSRMHFLFSQDQFFPTWWTMHPVHAPLLVAWAPDRSAVWFAGRPQAEVLDRALSTLERLLPQYAAEIRSEFVAGYMHDWKNDPFARGAYSYVAAGAEWAQRVLAHPVANTLFFAGEACDYTGHHATVHGAIASGLRAARSLRMAQAA